MQLTVESVSNVRRGTTSRGKVVPLALSKFLTASHALIMDRSALSARTITILRTRDVCRTIGTLTALFGKTMSADNALIFVSF